jgi:anti-sigma regulatory factor (Ser/Thr protein kinase)
MSDSAPAGGVTNSSRTGPADGDTAAGFRGHLRRWLNDNVQVDPHRVADIVLASYEALSNCAEHAYSNDLSANGAVMTMDVSHDPTEETVQVRVTDRGSWTQPDPGAIDAVRGRGLMLMHRLADKCTVQGRSDGTTLCLHFHRCPGLNSTGRACGTDGVGRGRGDGTRPGR